MWTYEEYCANIMVLDSAIRFVGIANREGKIFATATRPGLKLLLSKEDTEQSIKDAVLRFRVEPSLRNKIGTMVTRPNIQVTLEKLER